MIDYDVLAAYGTTNERLRELFTAETNSQDSIAPKGETKEQKATRQERINRTTADIEWRERWRNKIQSRLDEALTRNFNDWKLHAALDMAWDSSTLTKVSISLSMYAQGKINLESAVKQLEGIPGGERFLKDVDINGKPGKAIDMPSFVEAAINLVRSVIGRRHAAQKNKFSQLFPYYEYNPRGTSVVDKCRADVLSQRVEIVSDQYGYRHHDSQVFLDGMIHGPVIDFVESSWDRESQVYRKDMNFPATPDNRQEVITKEGVGWFCPNPTRTFWDSSHPLATLNTDSGCEYLGFWDIFRFSKIANDPAYFNKERVGYTGRLWERFSNNQDYFNNYLYQLAAPGSGQEVDLAIANDRVANIGLYSSSKPDESVFVCNYYEKVVPKDWGLGDYPWPVWVRFVVASDNTVIFAEIMPSTPGAALCIGARDNRQVNVSMAADLLAFQDHLTNLCTHMLCMCELEQFKILGINTDLINDESLLKQIRSVLTGRNYYSRPLVNEFSLSKLQDMGITTPMEKAISVVETRVGASISSLFDAMLRIIEMAEKLTAMSPAEQGQPAPREISATEVTEIANTTSSVYTSIGQDINEYRAAKKRIVYESLIACGRAEIYCPVKDRYTVKTMQAAGFLPANTEQSGIVQPAKPGRLMAMGLKHSLLHDYVFTSRDGAERPVNTQAANTLVQLIGQVLSVPMVAQKLGKEKLYMLFNEVFRMSGAGVDVVLELADGEDNSMGEDELESMKATIDQLTTMLQQMATQIQGVATNVQAQEQVNAEQQTILDSVGQLASQVQGLYTEFRQSQAEKNVSMEARKLVPYKDAPDPVKRQIEDAAGYQPALGATSTPQPTK
jgi:hypothetical protein